jgi:light-regulated signal transduction histidine kinase (bacteriophytochrome)
MKAAVAKVSDDHNAFEELGRATLQIVHDLKNQLNGIKLYATYLRKRLERHDQSVEERETLAKLIAGLDRAAKDMTMLVRYAHPIELRKQSRVDLARIVTAVTSEISTRETGGLPPVVIATHIESDNLLGEFDSIILTEAIKAITDDVRSTVKTKDANALSIHVRRDANAQTAEAIIEWHGANRMARQNSFPNSIGCGTVHTALGAKIIEAHGGRIRCEGDVIRAWLPLIN